MKLFLPRSGLLAIAAAALFVPRGATLLAQTSDNPDIRLFENGQGTLQFPGGPATPLPGVLAPDPGPGGQPAALTFNLLGPPALIAGDLFLTELSGISDLIRFNPAGTGDNPAYPASVVFYSLVDGDGALADVTFPTALYTNTFSLAENLSGATVYTPTANQPGFVPGFGVTYFITSNVPDSGTSIVLLSIALAGLVVIRRRIVISA